MREYDQEALVLVVVNQMKQYGQYGLGAGLGSLWFMDKFVSRFGAHQTKYYIIIIIRLFLFSTLQTNRL